MVPRGRFHTGYFFLYGLVIFAIYFLHYLSNSRVISYSFFGAFAAVALLLALTLHSKRFVPLRKLYGLAVSFLEIAIVVFAFDTVEGFALSAMTLDAAYVIFSAFFFAVFCNVCQRGNVVPMRLFALTYLVEYIAAMAGIIVALRLEGQGVVVGLVLLAAISSLMFSWLSTEADFRSAWGTAPSGRSYIDLAQYFQKLSAICTAITMQYALSPREADVLLYLAQQKTAPQIAEALFVSTSTVKTHTNSIYKKLGVHSRKELQEFIGLPQPDEG